MNTELFNDAEKKLKELEEETKRTQEEYWNKLHSLESKKVNIDDEMLKEWLEEYWLIYRNPDNSNEFFVAVPRFLNFSLGWLDHTTKGYNVFAINQYTQFLGELPDFIRKEVKLDKPDNIKVIGDTVKFEEGKEEEVKKKFGDLLSSIGRGTARIKKGKEFDLLAKIIESGSLPFIPNPVNKNDLRETQLNYKLEGKYSFQKDAFNTFLKYGAMGVYWIPKLLTLIKSSFLRRVFGVELLKSFLIKLQCFFVWYKNRDLIVEGEKL